MPFIFSLLSFIFSSYCLSPDFVSKMFNEVQNGSRLRVQNGSRLDVAGLLLVTSHFFKLFDFSDFYTPSYTHAPSENPTVQSWTTIYTSSAV